MVIAAFTVEWQVMAGKVGMSVQLFAAEDVLDVMAIFRNEN